MEWLHLSKPGGIYVVVLHGIGLDPVKELLNM